MLRDLPLIQEWLRESEDSGFARGWEEGYSRGWEEGYSRGWKEGYSRGWEEGFARGLEESFAHGRLEAARMIILKIAELRLGAPPAHVAALISECMDLERLIRVACEIVTYESWDESIPEHRDLPSGCRPFPESG